MRFPGNANWRLVLLAPVVIAAMAAIGCGGGGGVTSGSSDGTPKAGGTLKVAEYSEALTLNPFLAVDNASEHVFMQIIESLYQTAPNGKVVPLLATDAKPSDNYTKWRLPLREGVKFSNGKPLTAEDVVFSLEEIVASETWGVMYEAISEVKAVSPTEVEVEMSKPFPGLTDVLALPFAGIVEKDFGGVSAKDFGRNPVGTGPFELASWKHGTAITLEKNPNYWKQGRPYLDKVVITAPPSDEARVLQLKGEQADMIATPPTSQVAALESTPGLRVETSPFSVGAYILLNVSNPLFADPRVREAVDLAIDRDSYNQAALNGVGKVGSSWLPPVVNYWDDSIEVPTRNVAKAKSLLAEAVEEKGLDPNLSLMIAAGEATSSLGAQILQENLEDAGFGVKISPIDTAAKIEAELSGDYEITIEGISTDIIDPSELAGYYSGTAGFFTQADTSAMEKLTAEAAVEPDKAKLQEIYSEIQQHVADEREMITLAYTPWIWALHDEVIGFQLNPMGLPLFVDAGFSE